MLKKSIHRLPICNGPLTSTAMGLHLRSRTYAKVSGDEFRHDPQILQWPVPSASKKHPTPYQILRQKQGSPYSKEEFYRLVKFYHPDCHDSGSLPTTIPLATKIERYRLVVAAHALLADPDRRSLYDRTGEGWEEAGILSTSRDPSRPAAAWKYSRKDSGDPNSPFRNATWEDWEKWYRRNDELPPKPVYTSNGVFVGLILTFALLGAILQSMRVGNYSMAYITRHQEVHGQMSKELVQRRREMGEREQRIDGFLRHRDSWAEAMLDPKEVQIRSDLPTLDICSSDQIKRGKG